MVAVILLLVMLLYTVFVPATNACETQPGQSVATSNGAPSPSVSNGSYQPPEHSSDAVAERISTFMEGVALDDSHGYSWARRASGVDYDCSSAVFAAVNAAGVSLPGTPFTTYNMGPVLEAHGFAHLRWSGDWHQAKAQLMRGDILVNQTEHTEVYVGGGLFAAAHHACPSGTEDGHPGDQCTGDNQEIGIKGSIMKGLNDVYRHDPNAHAGAQPAGVGTPGSGAPAACPVKDAAQSGPSPDGTNAGAAAAQAIAKGLLPQYFPGANVDAEYGCLVTMWTHESGWDLHATNKSSGAYGIPQALPGSKMAAAGPDWQTNATTQIKWGLGYIKGRYSTPCGAWSSWQSKGWY